MNRDWLAGWWRRWQIRRRCLHHARTGGWGTYANGQRIGHAYQVAAGDPPIVDAVSYVEARLIDLGRRKQFTCRVCQRRWTVEMEGTGT